MAPSDQLETLLKELREHEWINVQQQELDQAELLLNSIASVADRRAIQPLIRIMGHFYPCGITTDLRKDILKILKKVGGRDIGLIVFQILESDDLTAEAAIEAAAAHTGSGAEEALAAAMQLWDPEGKAPQRALAALIAMGYRSEADMIVSRLPRFPHNTTTNVIPVDILPKR